MDRHPLQDRPATWVALIVGFLDVVCALLCFAILVWLLRCVITGELT